MIIVCLHEKNKYLKNNLLILWINQFFVIPRSMYFSVDNIIFCFHKNKFWPVFFKTTVYSIIFNQLSVFLNKQGYIMFFNERNIPAELMRLQSVVVRDNICSVFLIKKWKTIWHFSRFSRQQEYIQLLWEKNLRNNSVFLNYRFSFLIKEKQFR